MKKVLNSKSILLAIMIVFVSLVNVGCGGSANEDSIDEGEKGAANKEIVLNTFDHEVKYDKVPERVVSMNLHTTENLLALGLGDMIVGTAYGNAEILPEYKDIYESIPELAEKYPSMEVLLSVEPDFVYGRSSAFGEKGTASVDTLVENGIMPYVSKATYTQGATIEDTFEDFYNLGRIFDIEDRAEELVNEMKMKIENVQSKTDKIDNKLRIFVYDSGMDQAYTAGKSLQTNIISLAGGKNIFDDIEKTWAKVNWETVVKRDPNCIVINDYGNTSAEEKIEFLKSNPALSEITAIKENRFVILPLPSVFTGVRNGDAVEYLAKEFYPELFK